MEKAKSTIFVNFHVSFFHVIILYTDNEPSLEIKALGELYTYVTQTESKNQERIQLAEVDWNNE